MHSIQAKSVKFIVVRNNNTQKLDYITDSYEFSDSYQAATNYVA